MPRIAAAAVAIAQHRHRHATTVLEKLQYGDAETFSFGRFQSPEAIKKAFDDCRSPRSFRPYTGKDGRKGRVCSTKLGGDWVLAESEQIAPSCTCEQVLRAYLDAKLSMKWNADKIMDSKFTRKASPGSEAHYVQDLKIHSQRIIRTCTGVMRYSQRISVDKIGRGHCAAFVTLDPEQPSSTRKPFEALSVYVGLTQKGDDVQIYAAGVMEVNRKVVPNLVVFDASGIAGDQAGKGTLWLAGYFEERERSAAAATGRRRVTWAGARSFGRLGGRLLQRVRVGTAVAQPVGRETASA